MFGFVNASMEELTEDRKKRYTQVYCGICRDIRASASQTARLSLSYDMVFLALLLESLYEPETKTGSRACMLHPCSPRGWSSSPYTAYAADMNVALSYYKCLDDWQDDRRTGSLLMAKAMKPQMPGLEQRYPRQCGAISRCIRELSRLEKENCSNPDLPAGCFGSLMEELLVYRMDHWEGYLRQMGNALGRFIYLCDGAMDFREDRKKGRYNPFLAMGMEQEDYQRWDQYLILTMAACTRAFEMLPLVQDKEILDNILYSGVWLQYRRKQKRDSREESE